MVALASPFEKKREEKVTYKEQVWTSYGKIHARFASQGPGCWAGKLSQKGSDMDLDHVQGKRL